MKTTSSSFKSSEMWLYKGNASAHVIKLDTDTTGKTISAVARLTSSDVGSSSIVIGSSAGDVADSGISIDLDTSLLEENNRYTYQLIIDRGLVDQFVVFPEPSSERYTVNILEALDS